MFSILGKIHIIINIYINIIISPKFVCWLIASQIMLEDKYNHNDDDDFIIFSPRDTFY